MALLKELVQFGQHFDFKIRRDHRIKKKKNPMSAVSMSR